MKDKNNLNESELILLELYSDKKIDDKKDILLMLSTVKRLKSNFKESEKVLLETIKFANEIKSSKDKKNYFINLNKIYKIATKYERYIKFKNY